MNIHYRSFIELIFIQIEYYFTVGRILYQDYIIPFLVIEFSVINTDHCGIVISRETYVNPSSFSIENNAHTILYFEARITFYVKSVYDHDSIDYTYSEEQSVALFTNEYDIGTTLTKTIEFASNSWGDDEKNAYVLELRALSQSAYEYLKSIELYELGRYPDFGTGSIVPYNLYNNVTNGYGIFAGYSTVFSDMLIDNTKETLNDKV